MKHYFYKLNYKIVRTCTLVTRWLREGYRKYRKYISADITYSFATEYTYKTHDKYKFYMHTSLYLWTLQEGVYSLNKVTIVTISGENYCIGQGFTGKQTLSSVLYKNAMHT